MSKRNIKRDENGRLVNWYGFHVSNMAHEQKCYIDFALSGNPDTATLCVDGVPIVDIFYIEYPLDNMAQKRIVHTENEIAEYIYTTCRKYVSHFKIYVDEDQAESVRLAGNLEDILPEMCADIF